MTVLIVYSALCNITSWWKLFDAICLTTKFPAVKVNVFRFIFHYNMCSVSFDSVYLLGALSRIQKDISMSITQTCTENKGKVSLLVNELGVCVFLCALIFH